MVCEERGGRNPGGGSRPWQEGDWRPSGGEGSRSRCLETLTVTPALLHFWVAAMTAGKRQLPTYGAHAGQAPRRCCEPRAHSSSGEGPVYFPTKPESKHAAHLAHGGPESRTRPRVGIGVSPESSERNIGHPSGRGSRTDWAEIAEAGQEGPKSG